jgi:hypothetical protein
VATEAQQAAALAEPQQPATEVESQQAASVTAATPAVAVAALPTSPAPAAAGSPRAVVVEVPDDDDVPPLGWDQWVIAPLSAPEASAEALVARGDVGAVLGSPADGAGASSSRAGPAARLEQGQEDADALPAHFVEAQAEQGLWQELRDHGTSLNRALNEALRIHSGPAWRVFQVPLLSLRSCLFRRPPFSLCLLVAGAGAPGPGAIRRPRPPRRRPSMVPGVVRGPGRPRRGPEVT